MSDFRPMTQALPEVLSDLLRHAPDSPGKIALAWKTAVGPATARATSVRLEGTVLLVDAQTPIWTREVSQSSRAILGRLQRLLGDGVVTELRVRA
jgi:hypothetical protein